MIAEPWIVAIWPALLLLPLAAAYFAFLMPERGRLIGLSACVLNMVAVFLMAWQIGILGALRHEIGGWAAPLGIALQLDGLAALMLIAAAMVALAAGVYAAAYFSDERHEGIAPRFWPLWLFLLAALNALFMAADLFNVYVTLELMGIGGVALVALGGGRTGIAAALRYLLVGLAGSLCYLLGVGLIYAAYATVDLQLLSAVAPGPALGAGLALMSAGLIFKAGLFPFHFWLPPAHANAPAPVSAILSALVVEAAFYLVLRLWFGPAPASMTDAAPLLMGGMGAAAVLWGAVSALRAERLKMMVAYSTVAQLGYLFLSIPLVVKAGFTAWSGAALLVLAHALAKGAMFLSAGVILRVAGHDRITDLAGIAQRLPLTMITFALAGVSLIGLPPSGGFLAKWLLLNAAIDSEQWWVVLVLLVGSLLAAAYIFRVIGAAFNIEEGVGRHPSVPVLLEWPAFLLAVAGILLGLSGSGAAGLLTVGSPVDGRLLDASLP